MEPLAGRRCLGTTPRTLSRTQVAHGAWPLREHHIHVDSMQPLQVPAPAQPPPSGALRAPFQHARVPRQPSPAPSRQPLELPFRFGSSADPTMRRARDPGATVQSFASIPACLPLSEPLLPYAGQLKPAHCVMPAPTPARNLSSTNNTDLSFTHKYTCPKRQVLTDAWEGPDYYGGGGE